MVRDDVAYTMGAEMIQGPQVPGFAVERSVLFTAMVLITPQGHQVLTPMLMAAASEPASPV